MEPRCYDMLGLHRNASEVEVRSAYRRRALATHPDKGGTAIAFRAVVAAFEVLSTIVSRLAYDKELQDSGSSDGLLSAEWPAASKEASLKAPKKRRAHRSEVSFAESSSSFQAGNDGEQRDQSVEVLLRDLLAMAVEGWNERLSQASTPVVQAAAERLSVFERHNSSGQAGQEPGDTRPEKASDPGGLGRTTRRKRQAKEEDPNSDASTDSLDEETLQLAIGDIDDDDSFGKAVESEDILPPSASRRPLRSINIRGVYCRGNKGYGAAAYLHGFVMLSPQLDSLDEAIDFHTYLLRIRQRVKQGLAGEMTFEELIQEEVSALQAERQSSSLEPLQLSYMAVMPDGKNNLNSPCTRVLDKALRFWAQLRPLKAIRKRSLRLAAFQALLLEMRAEALEERTQLRELKAKRQRIYRFLRRALQHRLARDTAVLKKLWGVNELPCGIELCPVAEATMLCATLDLKDGSKLWGPPRKCLRQAVQERTELLRLQGRAGDEAVQVEAAYREADAMAALFLEQHPNASPNLRPSPSL